jgi:hypothetical protein
MIPLAPLLSGSIPNSFAYVTIKDRLPLILTKTIDALVRFEQTIDEKERISLINAISALKYDISRDKPLVALLQPPSAVWESAIMEIQEAENRTWFKAPWLLVECLMYELLRQAVGLSCSIPLDIFKHLKNQSMMESLPAMNAIATSLTNSQLEKGQLLHHSLLISLWGNQADLSLSFESQKGSNAHQADRLIVDDSSAVLDHLTKARDVVIILDNSGFELYSDLCLADCLTTLYGCKIQLQCKSFPWFVSDVTPQDFEELFLAMENHSEALKRQASQWRLSISQGDWSINHHEFFTGPHPYWKIVDEISIYTTLCATDFIIFKGDLNYRKV